MINTIKREFERLKNARFVLFAIVFVPLALCFFMFFVFSKGTITKLPVAILDLDNSSFSRTVARMINSTPSCSVKYKIQNINEGFDLVKKGKIYSIIVIPRDFKKDLNTLKRPKITYYYNNQTILIAGVITKDIQAALLTFSKGVDVSVRLKKGLSKKAVLSKINLIKIDERVRSNPYLNYSYFLNWAIIAHTFQVMVTLITIWAVGSELKEGTAKKWLKSANGSIVKAVFGKIIFYNLIFLAELFFVYSIFILTSKGEFEGNFLFLFVSSFVFLLAYQMAGAAFVAVTSNMRLSISSGAFYTSLGFTFAGMTYPASAMPLFGRIYSALLPVRPYVRLLIDQSMRGFDIRYDMIYVFWMIALAAFFASTLPLLRKHSLNEELWYQI